MKNLFISLAIFLILLSINASGYDNLTVGDPRNSWWTYSGSIEAAEIHVRPYGIYMCYDMFLTFSAQNTSFASTDTLEVVLTFNLPQNAIVNDSWLWFGSDTLRGMILDKWTATSIYEGVVNRRRDPSILQKMYGNQYELRIFPMAGNETRKVKISFMLPTQWDKYKVSSTLLTNILETSFTPLQKLTLISFTNDTWGVPTLHGIPETDFTYSNTPALGEHYKTEVANQYFKNNLSISYSSPAKNGIYLSKFTNNDEGIYQLALLPSTFINESAGKNVAVLFDYDLSNTSISANQVVESTRDLLLKNLTSKDSFNLFFSNISIVHGNDWLKADSLTITNVFNNLVNPLSGYSNLPSLISTAVEFIKSHGDNGKIVLISNSDQYRESQLANKLLNDVMALMNNNYPFHIADYNTSYSGYYINGRYYYGNEYFFSNLSKFTNGSLEMARNGKTFSETVENSLNRLSGSIKSFDLHTSLNGGICYGRYTLGTTSDIIYINSPVLQVGKFKGEMPFNIDISGEYNSEIISEEITLNETDIHQSDSLLESVWAGTYILHMEKQNQTNDVINEIIHKSLSERVLSQYTAFLCIEKSLICEDCQTDITETELQSQTLLKVYPNPFSSEVTVKINLDAGGSEKILTAGVYSITGQQVYIPDISKIIAGTETEFQWNGKDGDGNNLPAGVYIFVLKTDKNIYQVKLLKI